MRQNTVNPTPTHIQKRNNLGAVMSEFVIIVPLLVIFLTGILEFGRTLNQVAWLSQTSYEAARVGGNSAAPQGQAAMTRVANLYYDLLGRELEGDSSSVIGSYDSEERLVRVELNDKVKVLLGAYELDLKFELAGPHLALLVPSQTQDYENTDQPYDCIGEGGEFEGGSFCCLVDGCSSPPSPTACRYLEDNCMSSDGASVDPSVVADILEKQGQAAVAHFR